MVAAKSEATPSAPSMNIYQIIAAVGSEAGALAPESKGGVPFAFRGVDGTVAHLVPHLRKYGVITVPEVLEQKVTTRELSAGKAITQTEVLTKFHFYAPDGSSVSATTAGLAQDYADRSTAQAQSVAFRVALLQTFTLPTHDKEPEQAGEETQKFIAANPKVAPKPSAEPVPSGAAALTAIQSRVRDLSSEVAGAGKGKELLQSLAASKWEGKSFLDVWKSVGALEELELELGKMKAAK